MKLLNIFLLLTIFSFIQLNAQYCTLQSDDSSSEWIQSITVGSFTNNSGNNNGYINYTGNQNIDLQKGSSYNVNLSPGYSGESYTEYWKIWIDFNQDGDFTDSGELVFQSNEGQQGTETGNITIPNNNNTETGSTRMRIAMKWVGTLNDGTDDTAAPSSCGTFNFGEVEDYSVNIISGSGSSNNYCSANGDSSADEWIQSISIGDFNYNSGNNNGYADFSDNNNATINLENNSTYNLSLNPGYSGESFTEYWRIWIDLNNDNDFTDANELIYDAGNGNSGVINANISIPNVTINNATMRVAMKWVGTLNDGTPDTNAPNNCGTFNFGEVEDYRINITNNNNTTNIPDANFTSNITSGSSPLTVNFTDLSTNNPTSWQWSFPGGNPSSSTQQNPTVVYNNPGTYNVTLTTSNSAGSDTQQTNNYITVTENVQIPNANFTSNVTSGNGPLTVSFTDLSTNNPTSWQWSFPGGNPSSSTQQNPTVVYNNPGTYNVTLTTSNSAGSDTQQSNNYITVADNVQIPDANFTANVTSGNGPLTVSFTDLSTNNPTNWQWSFPGGNPSSSTQQNPTVVYNNPGTYTVSLTSSNNAGANIETKDAFITVSTATVAPQAFFGSNVTSGQTPLSVQFIDQSTNLPTNWNWVFEGGNPNTSTLQNPFVVYNQPGTYSVTLQVSNSAGNDMITQQGYITVNAANLAPVANFSSDKISGAAPMQVQFTDISLNSPTAWSWFFEGGSPSTSSLQNPSVAYNNPGNYTVTLTTSNSIGTDTKTVQAYIEVLEQQPLPNTAFTASIYSGPAPLSVTFFDQTTNDPIAWEWEFPGGSPGSSNEKNPTITYNNPGVFQVTLKATNATGSDTQTQQEYITVEFPTGIDDIEEDKLDLTLYPNPTTDQINIETFIKTPNNPQLYLYNALGQRLQQISLAKQNDISLNLDMTTYPTGLYFIKILDDEFEMEQRFEKL